MSLIAVLAIVALMNSIHELFYELLGLQPRIIFLASINLLIAFIFNRLIMQPRNWQEIMKNTQTPTWCFPIFSTLHVVVNSKTFCLLPEIQIKASNPTIHESGTSKCLIILLGTGLKHFFFFAIWYQNSRWFIYFPSISHLFAASLLDI